MRIVGRVVLAAGALLVLATLVSLRSVDGSLENIVTHGDTLQVTDRNGLPLSASYTNRWNRYDTLPLHAMPELLVDAFVLSEDKRFYAHSGVDWRARGSALLQAVKSGGAQRGASSIPEQVVRMLHPRPRNLWSKWLEGFEATSLARHYSKEDILEFYLNQLPYAGQRRGVAQASRYYFDRSLDTLTPKELLALVVLVRAPSAYDLYKHQGKIDAAIMRLAKNLQAAGKMDDTALARLSEAFALQLPGLPVDASHFVRSLRLRAAPHANSARIRTTLDAGLQRKVQGLLDDRLRQLKTKKAGQAAALVVDHETGDVLAWAVAGDTDIDIVTSARQPGSSLKPFLYAAALTKGWTAATIIEDAPISEAIGSGLHRFRNYSHQYYGDVTLREALGNSLNTPALRTINFVTPPAYLKLLHKLGFASLALSADIYDEGLALGAGEVTLFELVQAYSALAHYGEFRPLVLTIDDAPRPPAEQVVSYEVASIIGNILSDPHARSKEFGRSSILNLPVATAVKTGTSTDYRDAWAVGYNHRYTVGVWVGNIDGAAMDGVTGSTGPALTLRAVFAELTRQGDTKPLAMSAKLERHDVCIGEPCMKRTEYFVPGTFETLKANVKKPETLELVQPTENLRLAIDPRVPRELQQFTFQLKGLKADEWANWVLDGKDLGDTRGEYVWRLERGKHVLEVKLVRNKAARSVAKVPFVVK